MQAAEARDMALGPIQARQPDVARSLVNPASPDGDPAKFLIDGNAARAIHRYNGWQAPISLGWFNGGYDPPAISKTPFHWYAFAIPKLGQYQADHYFICDYLQMRDWVLSFTAPLGNTHRSQRSWRCDQRLYPGGSSRPVRHPAHRGRPQQGTSHGAMIKMPAAQGRKMPATTKVPVWKQLLALAGLPAMRHDRVRRLLRVLQGRRLWA